MKTAYKVIGILLLGMVLFGIGSLLTQTHRESGLKQAVEDTRRMLKAQGFKTGLSDFNFTTDAASQAREQALMTSGFGMRAESPVEEIKFLPPAGDDAAIVIWKQDWIRTESEPVHWEDVRDWQNTNSVELDEACNAAMAGPIHFNLDASRGAMMLLKHLAALKHLSQSLGANAMLELHEGHPAPAWTNLMAATRLVTAWEPEPVEVSHTVRFGLASLAFNETWQVLQTNHWQDEQLAQLQAEWQAVDYFTNLPETVAFKRASWVGFCQRERQQPISGKLFGGDFFKEAYRSPRSAWAMLNRYRNQANYRSEGTYEDEKVLLLFYRDREVELRNAVQASNWRQMCQLPGVTNKNIFQSPHLSGLQSVINLRESSMGIMNRGASFLGRAAEAEARRRIIVTAIALERYRGKHGNYPQTLAGLVPEFLKTGPLDFMDGQPLRYRLADDDDHFVLYSIGLDGVDDGGKLPSNKLPPPAHMRGAFMTFDPSAPPTEADLVWPRAANASELAGITQAQQQEEAARLREADEAEGFTAEEEWNHTANHQAGIENLPTNSIWPVQPDVSYDGHALSEVLRNRGMSGDTNKLSLGEMLSLRQVITGAEPEVITFQVPIAYDKLASFGSLTLLVDTNNDGAETGCYAVLTECSRASNGDCLLAWNTIYECPGKHVLQMVVSLDKPIRNRDFVFGPMSVVTVSNLCQFSAGSVHFEPETGATWRARLPEANGNYVMECNAADGTRLKTITGSTTNGVIKVHWDLMDDRGQRFTGHSFDSVFHITLPDSGRTQTLRGP